jgi:ATP-dependent DNA helicase RecG
LEKKSHSRNPLIFGLFARMQLVEQVGSGIGRIQELMEKAGLPEASFRKEGMFTVILQRPHPSEVAQDEAGSEKSSEKGSEKGSEKILELLRENPKLTIAEIAEAISISTRAVEKKIARLKEEGILTRQGPDRGGQWQVRQE